MEPVYVGLAKILSLPLGKSFNNLRSGKIHISFVLHNTFRID